MGDGDATREQCSLGELAIAAERPQSVDELDDDLRELSSAGSSWRSADEVGGQLWFVKFQAEADNFPECLAEFAAMRLASSCGLAAAASTRAGL